MSNSAKHYYCNECRNYFEYINSDEIVCCPDCGSFDVELWDESE